MKLKGFKMSETRLGRIYRRDAVSVGRTACRLWAVRLDGFYVTHFDQRHKALEFAVEVWRRDLPLHEQQ